MADDGPREALDPWLLEGHSREMLFEFHLALFDRALEVRRVFWDDVSLESWEAERARLAALFAGIFGPFPEKCDLAARTTKSFEREGYRVENVMFDSLPGLPITANLYLPAGLQDPAPGICLACGHSAIAKAYERYQMAAIDLARRGMVVLCFDPFGQGERFQLWDSVRHQPLVYGEHDILDRAAVLAGTSSPGEYTWDAVRAVDYLVSREEVDPARIGMTGCSGGGTQTTFAATVDERIAAAVPICFVTSVRERLLSREPGDSEQYPYDVLAHGLEYADYLAMLAPKPLLIAAAVEDYFPLKGARDTTAALKRIWALTGDEDKAELFEGPGKHGLSDEIRRATGDWFCRWFDLPIPEQDPEVVPEEEETLWATRSGQVAVEGGYRDWYHMTADTVPAMEALRARDVSPDELAEVLALPNSAEEADGFDRLEASGDSDITCLRLESEQGITVPAVLFEPTSTSADRLVVYCHEDGFHAEAGPAGIIEKLRAAGHRVLAFDPRGVGLTRGDAHGWWANSTKSPFEWLHKDGSFHAEVILGFNDPSYEGPMATECEHAWTARQLGRPLLGQRAMDVLRVLNEAESFGESGGRVVLMGSGIGALWALYASPFAPQSVAGLILHAPLASYRPLLEEPRATWHQQVLVRNLPAVGDCPAVIAHWAPKPALVIDPHGPFRTPISPWEARRIYGEPPPANLSLRWSEGTQPAQLAVDFMREALD